MEAAAQPPDAPSLVGTVSEPASLTTATVSAVVEPETSSQDALTATENATSAGPRDAEPQTEAGQTVPVQSKAGKKGGGAAGTGGSTANWARKPLTPEQRQLTAVGTMRDD